MRRELIENHLRGSPFVPFEVATSGGERFTVTDPDLFLVYADHIFYAFPGGRAVTIWSAAITSIETLSDGPVPGGSDD